MKKRLFPLTTGGGGGGSQPTLISKNVSANGTYLAASDLADGYSSVTVAVPEPILKTKSITENGSYAASGDGADGFSNVVVNVQTSQPDLISKSITENGSYSASDDSADGYSDVTVAVPENFEKYHIVATSVNGVVSLAITDYVDQATDNYYVGTIAENGVQNLYILTEDGEPVILVPKTISANGSYLPASDNANGYSSVTVAVPIPSPALDTKTITTNGTYTAQDDSLDGYSEVVVDVPTPQPALGTKTITANGTFEAQNDSLDGYSSVTVNVADTAPYRLKRNVYNYDGTLISSDFIKKGDAVYLPSEPPVIDDPLLEFAEWTCTTDEQTVTNAYNIGAICRIKEQIDVNGTLVRPTIIEINLSQDIGLTPTIRYRYLKGEPLYINWGDGNIDTINDGGTGYGASTISHTYSASGKYYIKMYSVNEYGLWSSSWSNYVFGNADYNACVSKAYIGENWGADAYAFYKCGLEKCIITCDALNLGTYFCGACYGVTSAIIPQGITTISANAFVDWGTKIVVLPYTLTSLATEAFKRNCFDLVIPNHLTAIARSTEGEIFNDVTIVPDSITRLGDYAMYNNYSKIIELSPNCTNFGTQAFGQCKRLKEITIPTGTLTLPTQCFGYCFSLEHIELPNTLTSIGNNCFYNCYALKELIIPDSVTTLGTYFIENCYALETLKIPTGYSSSLNLRQLFKLTTESYVNIAKDIADLTSATAQTLSIQNWQQAKLSKIFVDSNGDIDASSSTSLIDFITSKNWTISVVA